MDRRNCLYRDFWPLLPPAATASSISLLEARFLTAGSLSFYYQQQINGSLKTTRYLVTAAGQSRPRFQYLALGDSFASGEGTYDYRDGTDVAYNRCHSSNVAYPYLIRQALLLTSAESVACSGGRIHNVYTFGADSNFAQADSKESASFDDDILLHFLPGYRQQITFVEHYLPDIITISVGGNDIGFVDKLLRCLAPDTCFSSYEDRLEIFREVADKRQILANLYQTLKQHALPTTRLYVIGYPELAKNNGNCGTNVHLSAEEISFSNLLIDHLNQTIAQAAQDAAVTFIDVSRAFDGHRLCEAPYSSAAVNGLTAGNDIVDWWFFHGPFGNESYHPTALGHRLLRDYILKQTDNFTRSASVADTNGPEADTNEQASPLVMNTPKTNRPVHALVLNRAVAPDVVVKSHPWRLILANENNLKPGTQAQLRWDDNDQPSELLVVDDSGSLNQQVDTPATLSPGFHMIHLLVTNISSTPQDMYKTVYVAANDDDLDGDGTVNSHDSCGASTDSTDQDKDGLADACDPVITNPPAEVTGDLTSRSSPSTDYELMNRKEVVPSKVSPVSKEAASEVSNDEGADTADGPRLSLLGARTQPQPVAEKQEVLGVAAALNDQIGRLRRTSIVWQWSGVACLALVIFIGQKRLRVRKRNSS